MIALKLTFKSKSALQKVEKQTQRAEQFFESDNEHFSGWQSG